MTQRCCASTGAKTSSSITLADRWVANLPVFHFNSLFDPHLLVGSGGNFVVLEFKPHQIEIVSYHHSIATDPDR